MKQIEQENVLLKELLAERHLEIEVMKEVNRLGQSHTRHLVCNACNAAAPMRSSRHAVEPVCAALSASRTGAVNPLRHR